MSWAQCFEVSDPLSHHSSFQNQERLQMNFNNLHRTFNQDCCPFRLNHAGPNKRKLLSHGSETVTEKCSCSPAFIQKLASLCPTSWVHSFPEGHRLDVWRQLYLHAEQLLCLFLLLLCDINTLDLHTFFPHLAEGQFYTDSCRMKSSVLRDTALHKMN